VFSVQFPPRWAELFATFLECSKGTTYLFSVDGVSTDTTVYNDAFRLFFRCGVAGLEPYDARRLVTSCYFQVGVSSETLQAFGGWTTEKNMRDCYIESGFLVPPRVRYLFEWLVSSKGVHSVTTASALVEAPPPKRVRKEVSLMDL
jgi:hypothetical protein